MNHFSACTTFPHLANTDHMELFVTMEYSHVGFTPTFCHCIWLYKHANFDRANDLLCDLNYDEILESSDMQLSCIHFKNTFLDIIQLIIRRYYYFHEAIHSGSRKDLDIFKQLRNRVIPKLRSAK